MRRTLWVLVLLNAAEGFAQRPTPPRPEDDAGIAPRRQLELDTSVFPPRPKGYRQATAPGDTLTIVKSAVVLDAARVAALRRRAEEDDRVQAALGTRSRFLSAWLAEVGSKTDPAPPYEARLEYFNYPLNRAVHVRFSGDQVAAVKVQTRGYQPPESDDEVAAAADIVKGDPRFRTAVEGLPVRGIRTVAPEGRRYLYLMFKQPGKPAVFDATVDLTSNRIVEAGPVKHQ